MRTIQKYEFYSSVAAIVAAIVQIAFFVFVAERSNNEFPLLFLGFAFVIFPTIVISICSHLHINEGSKISFVIILSLGIVFVCFYTCVVLLGVLVGVEMNIAAIFGLLAWVLPIFFVACTVIFAMMNSSSQSPLTDSRLS
jgi:hypothetical protein